MPIVVKHLDAEAALAALAALAGLLEDCVVGGASVGFLLPLAEGELERYWGGVVASVRAGDKLLLAAREEGQLVGSVQVALEPRANGSHRAEIQKLLVLRAARRQGLGAALMVAAEEAARAAGRTLLVLDTREDDDGKRLYLRQGFQIAGVIPRYARSVEGVLEGSCFMYKDLEGATALA